MHLSEQVITNKNDIKVLIEKIEALEKKLKEVDSKAPDFYRDSEEEFSKNDSADEKPAS